MGKNYTRINIRPDTKELLMKQCVRVFLEHHPEFEGMHLTENFMMRKVCEYYITS